MFSKSPVSVDLCIPTGERRGFGASVPLLPKASPMVFSEVSDGLAESATLV